MPHQINVPGEGVIEFPDSMNDGQITSAIQEMFYSKSPASQTGSTQADPAALKTGMDLAAGVTQTLSNTLVAGAEGSKMAQEWAGAVRQKINYGIESAIQATNRARKGWDIGKASALTPSDTSFIEVVLNHDKRQTPHNALEVAIKNWETGGMLTAPVNTGDKPTEFGGTQINPTVGVQIPTVTPPPEAGVTEKVAAGLWNVGVSIPNFMLSAEGIATMLVPEALPARYAEPLLKGLFAGLMAKATGEQAGKASVTQDPQDITEAAGSLALTLGLGYSGAFKALEERRKQQGMEPIKPPIRDLIQTLIDKVNPKADPIAKDAPLTAEALKGQEQTTQEAKASQVTNPAQSKEAAAPEEKKSEQVAGDTQAATEGDQTVTPALGEKEGMGGAKLGEIPDTGAGGEKYGIAQRVRDERAKAGQVDPVEPGTGVSLPDSIERGRELNAADPGAAERMLTEFEDDPQKRISADLIASTRAHGEALAKEARRIESKFGTDSGEYAVARENLNEWDRRTKPMQTEWHKAGMAQQGATDLDTGSVTGLERERIRLTDKEFTPEEKDKAGKIAKEVSGAEQATDKAATDIATELDENSSPERKHETDKAKVTGAIKNANESADLEQAAQNALDAASKTVRENAIRQADAENVARVEQAKRDLEVAKQQLKEAERARAAEDKAVRESAVRGAKEENAARVQKAQDEAEAARVRVKAAEDAKAAAEKAVREDAIRRASAEEKARVAQAKRDLATAKIQLKAATKAREAADKAVRNAAIQAAKSEAKVQERTKLNEQAKAAQDAIDAAHKTVREWAQRRADLENKARVAKAGKERETAQIQVKAAQKAQEAAWEAVRQAARESAKLQRKILADPSIPVWEKARQYLDRGIVNFDDLRAKVAADLGMPADKVAKLLARDNRMKHLADDLWLKLQRERNAKTKARLWVQGLDTPAYEKFIHGLPRVLFKIRVGFHGTVALGTHAPAVAFDPRFWGTYVRDFGKMYRMVTSPAFHEGQMQDLMRRQNYGTALRAGLMVDPFKYEDFNYPNAETGTHAKISKAMADSLGIDVSWFTKTGERGYAILKVLRQDMFDQHWDALPRQMRTKEVAQAISTAVNHITGVVKTQAPFGAELALFAPKLQMSRVGFLAVDPLRALKTGARAGVRAAGLAMGRSRSALPEVTPAEKWFAGNEIKTKAYILGTLGSLLALNQGVLTASGSKQKVNMTNPFRSDFGKFKIEGLNLSYGNPLLTMARLPIRVGSLAMGPGGKLRKLIYPDEDAARMAWEFFRSQLSPAASLTADVVFREDFQRRQLPFSERPQPKRLLAQGIEPYTTGEYVTQQALPIPFQEFAREVWRTGFGMDDKQIEAMNKAFWSTLFMAGTGGRMGHDYEVEDSQ